MEGFLIKFVVITDATKKSQNLKLSKPNSDKI